MAFTSDLVLDTDKTFSLISTKGQTSVRSNPARSVDSPQTLVISHETLKDGRTSSVAYIDNQDALSELTDGTLTDNIRSMYKVQYNPNSGRTGIETAIAADIDILVSLINDPALLAKFLNRES